MRDFRRTLRVVGGAEDVDFVLDDEKMDDQDAFWRWPSQLIVGAAFGESGQRSTV